MERQIRVCALCREHIQDSRPFLSEVTGADIKTSPSAFTQILDNLISSAVKFSEKGTQISTKSEIMPENTVRISIKDQGLGLPPEDHLKLFGKFMRLSAHPTDDGHSTVLGLSIFRALAEAMNGKIWREGETGKGATFIVELERHTHSAQPETSEGLHFGNRSKQ